MARNQSKHVRVRVRRGLQAAERPAVQSPEGKSGLRFNPSGDWNPYPGVPKFCFRRISVLFLGGGRRRQSTPGEAGSDCLRAETRESGTLIPCVLSKEKGREKVVHFCQSIWYFVKFFSTICQINSHFVKSFVNVFCTLSNYLSKYFVHCQIFRTLSNHLSKCQTICACVLVLFAGRPRLRQIRDREVAARQYPRGRRRAARQGSRTEVAGRLCSSGGDYWATYFAELNGRGGQSDGAGVPGPAPTLAWADQDRLAPAVRPVYAGGDVSNCFAFEIFWWPNQQWACA